MAAKESTEKTVKIKLFKGTGKYARASMPTTYLWA